ncbi:E3 ubiquitin-protein ligase TRIM38-like [Sorex araneus]|uniref:E3 ubiquitin-protein ligase TRIM38-like n=1 Tax=Sorex araneus TaxID=42254 RepID=UPI0024335A47|nr:E3 ubiquitin-protein ligase TRIM38-like [Sorex araneus]
MASGTAKTMREKVTCPICLELMTEPVMIDCGHIYCRSCILENLENQQQQLPSGGNFHCPVCRAQFQRENIRPSKQLESIIDTIKKMEQEHLCEKHGEKLSLFCRYDGQLICWCCERTPQHKGHSTVLVADAYRGYKEKFQKTLTYLRKQEEQNKEWQGNIREQIRNFQSEILDKKYCIEYSFMVFHMILHMEEQSYLWRLENEEQQVLKRLQESEAQLQKQSQELNKHILEMERKCQASAHELLQDKGGIARLSTSVQTSATSLVSQSLGLYVNFPDVRDTLVRISAMKLNKPEDVSLDIHAMPDVDGIFCELIKLFETDYVKVTLDPDTAHNDLHVDKDENTVIGGRNQEKQDTPSRFKDLPCVLGCEAFTSGKYYFEIYFTGGSDWDVGVCLENVPRDNFMVREPETGFWAIRHHENDDNVALTSPITPLFRNNLTYLLSLWIQIQLTVSYIWLRVGSKCLVDSPRGSVIHLGDFESNLVSWDVRPSLQDNMTLKCPCQQDLSRMQEFVWKMCQGIVK